ncbi:endonuclease III [Candidatus Pacearchaeota archaeon]|nr:endonuclease III [Candidatus Pacearchaeota archaeon]
MSIKTSTAIKQFNEIKKYIKNSKMRLAAELWDSSWKTLIATVLSARARDEKTIPTAEKLFKKYNTIKKLANASLSSIQEIIRPINFYKNKSKSVLACAKVLVEKYNSKIPFEFEKLISLPGVGRKTANVFLSELGYDTIGVDTHVSYISQKLGWVDSNKAEKIESALKKLFPKSYWKRINPALVRFGKTYTSKKIKNNILEKIKRIK